jgi:hypothetical protein
MFLKHILLIRAIAVFLNTYCITMHSDSKAYGEIVLIIRSDIRRYEIDKENSYRLLASLALKIGIVILLFQPYTYHLSML